MTSTYYPLDKKEKTLPDTPQSPYYNNSVPAAPQMEMNIPTSAPSPFNSGLFASASARRPQACSATRTPSSSSSSSSSSSCSARKQEKEAYKAQKRLLKDQARAAKCEARTQAKLLKREQSLTHRQEKDLRHEIRAQAKMFKHEIKQQCKELKRELKQQHHSMKHGYYVPSIPSVPSQPSAPSLPSFVSPPQHLVQAQPAVYGPGGIYPQPQLVPTSSQAMNYGGCYGRHKAHHNRHRHECHQMHGGPLPVRIAHNVISRTLTTVSQHLQDQVNTLQQQRLRHEYEQRPTITVAPAPLLPTPVATAMPTETHYHPPTTPPPPEKEIGPQNDVLVYSMSNMSLHSSPSSSSTPVPHAIPRPDLVQQQQRQKEEDEEDINVPPPSYEASLSARRV
ncbi:hypothetical protein FBU30_009241 [Linnemannia zychae]|nr:hypothetical protein FBU30_009241 [Linnemannia zychae]